MEFTWEVPFDETPYRPATRLDPSEGGVELDGDPELVEITIYPDSGDALTIRDLSEKLKGSVICQHPPTDDDCMGAILDQQSAEIRDY